MSKRAHGEGSLYQLPNGKWRGAVDLGWEGGRRRRRYVYGSSQREARDKLDAFRRAQADGLTPAPERLTLGKFLDDWLTEVVAPATSPKTYRTYAGVVRVHLKPTLGHIRLRALAPIDVQRMLNAKAKEGLSKRSVAMIREVLRNALGGAIRMGYLARNPAELVSVPTPERRRVTPYTAVQVRRFLEAAGRDRLGALYATVIGLGLRQGEALGMRWTDLDLEASTLAVSGALKRVDGLLARQAPKTASSRRTLPLPDFVRDSLQRHRVRQIEERLAAGDRWRDTGYVFTTSVGTPLDGPTVTKRLHALLEAADLPDLTFHDLRHQFASILLGQGEQLKVVSELLGHQDSALTLRTYSHVLEEAKTTAVRRLDALVAGG